MRDQIDRRQRNMEDAIEEAERNSSSAGWTNITSQPSTSLFDDGLPIKVEESDDLLVQADPEEEISPDMKMESSPDPQPGEAEEEPAKE